MGCTSPLRVWHSKEVNESTGKRGITFSDSYAYEKDMPFEIACKQCNSCLRDRSGNWGLRLYGESMQYDNNHFLTLTFDEENLHKRENPLSVDKRDMQLFNKRLRKSIASENPHDKIENPEEFKSWNKAHKLKFYQIWEYGELNNRPHYHSLLFNVPYFDDLVLYSQGKNGDNLYKSEKLAKLWPHGQCAIGEVNMDTIGYTTNYVVNNKSGEGAEEYYSRTDLETGEVYQVEKQGSSMSKGLGNQFYEDFRNDMYPKDFITLSGRKTKLPKYYDLLEELADPIRFDEIKEKRLESAMKFKNDDTPERRKVKEKVSLLKKKEKSLRDFRSAS